MRFTLQKKYQQKTPILKGFSIGEVLLAAFVLTSGLLATSALMSTSLHNSFETRDAIIATQLSQEGVELVRNVRDNDFAKGRDGFTGFNAGHKHCRIEYNDPLPPPPPPPTDMDCRGSLGSTSRYTLHYNVSGFYEHTGSSTERFSRYIYRDYSNSDKTATIRSFVYWGNVTDPDMFALSDVGTTGITVDCVIAKKCVYTEVTLTSWK